MLFLSSHLSYDPLTAKNSHTPLVDKCEAAFLLKATILEDMIDIREIKEGRKHVATAVKSGVRWCALMAPGFGLSFGSSSILDMASNASWTEIEA